MVSPEGVEPRRASERYAALFAELETLRRRIAAEALSQKVAGRWWAAVFIGVGGLAALLSGAAGVTAAQPQQGGLSDWVATLAIAGAGLTALTTALNPGWRWEQAHSLYLACQSLELEVRVLLRVDFGADGFDARERLGKIATQYDALLGVPERPRLWTPTGSSGT